VRLADVPLLFALVGLAFYTVLGGADFGAGFWQLTAGTGPRAGRIRKHALHAMGPVWEANHVWLIFVLVVVWTAYPLAFGSIASTLSIPLFVAAVGIILRGTAYALRSAAESAEELGLIGTVFSLSSILTPFALGAAVGGIASRRVPVGNAAGDLVSSWLNPTSATIGALAVALGAYTAAVFLAGDAVRHGDRELAEAFQRRALGTGAVAGALAVGSVAVLRWDARPLYHGLVQGRGLVALIVSIVAGVGTLALVSRRRYEPSRFTAALAAAAIIAGWALAQSPVLLPGLTVDRAAAPRETLVAVVVAVLVGAVILVPSLLLLFRLYLGGRFDAGGRTAAAGPARARAVVGASARGLAPRLSVALLLAGIGFTTFADSAWAHALGAASLLGFVAVAFPAALPPPEVSPSRPGRREGS
jgi:cytochrome d ubiquinol oxidase subunit II